MALPFGAVLFRAGETVSRVYFPFDGAVSLVVGLNSGQFVEAAMFGRNGVIGVGAAMYSQIALNQAMGQVGGTGLCADVGAIREVAPQSDTLLAAFGPYVQAMFAQTQQVGVCNAVHDLDQRLCRRLTRDLAMSDDLPLTQEFVAEMLGVQRSSVTLVASRLQQAGLIQYRRGMIHVLDPERLRAGCCECYDAINAHLLRLTGWSPVRS